VRRPLAAFTRRRPDMVTAAFIELVAALAVVVPAHLPPPPD